MINIRMEKVLRGVEKFIPGPVYRFFQPIYHFLLTLFGHIIYRFPSQKIRVVGITGTKGKTSVVEFADAVFRAGGHKTALASSLHFKIGENDTRNTKRMSTPGRFFLPRLMRKAISQGCDTVILEMTSESTKQFRHLFIELDALIFTNLAPEHIESHGSFEKYRDAKLKLAKRLRNSKKHPKFMVANVDDEHGKTFLETASVTNKPYSLSDLDHFDARSDGSVFTYKGTTVNSHFPGKFSISNMLAVAVLSDSFGITVDAIKKGLESVTEIKGRVERITSEKGFTVIVDYAHTPDSLKALYSAYPHARKICVLGSTGGGRDKWKRPEMGKVADELCDHVIVTNEDPYDEDPKEIIDHVARGVTRHKAEIILDRREAIRSAVSKADKGDVVFVTGKGTDPCICGPNGSKIPWDDMSVVKEEIEKLDK